MDVVDRATRSRMMGAIRGKNTRPELAVRKFLFSAGLRYRIHAKNVPGRPDIVLPRFRTAILVHGCFWHRHAGCKYAYVPKSNRDFWLSKFASNVERDRKVRAGLKKLGWRVVTIWGCEVSPRRLNRLLRLIRGP